MRARLSALPVILLLACSRENNVNVAGGDTTARAGAAGAGAGSGAASSSGAGAGAGKGGSSGSGGSAGGAASTVGNTCTASSECVASACVAGVCRNACKADVECDAKSLCLADGAASGCRLPAEATCDTPGKPCANAALVCGIDKTCRMPCTTSCPREGQACIAGACVDAAEPGASMSFFSCTSIAGATSGKTCEGAMLLSCNETAPGETMIGTCASPALCQATAKAGHATCDAPACTPGALSCGGKDGATVQKCKVDQTGFEDVDAAHVCATSALCLLTKEAAQSSGTLGACKPPVCDAGAGQCVGGAAKACNAGRTGFDVVATCNGATPQCDPVKTACIAIDMDATEVTREAYKAFLVSIGDADGAGTPATKPPQQPAACKANVDFTPAAFWTPSDQANGKTPVSGIDWCDARAYCASIGRRLCGRIGGGVLPKADFADPGKSEWQNMCSSGGANTHAFGAWKGASSEETCNGAGNWLTTDTPVPVDVGSKTGCVSAAPGYVGHFDLTGNVAEWEDACDASADTGTASDGCRVRGGAFTSETSAQLACGADRVLSRSASAPDVGFRCCK